MKRPRILILAYTFPPFNFAGTHRLRFFVKYLHDLGWVCAIVTINETYAGPKDPQLVNSIPSDVIIRRTKTLDPSRFINRFQTYGPQSKTSSKAKRIPILAVLAKIYHFFVRLFFLPDEAMFWQWMALPAAERCVRDFKPDIILSSSLPNSTHLLAARLSKKYGIPFAADFRDEWSQNSYRKPITPLHDFIQRKLERNVLRAASLVTATTEPMAKQLARLAPDSRAIFETIYNGFDNTGIRTEEKKTTAKFQVVHTGNFYGERSPAPFISAAAELVRSGAIKREDIEIIFAGSALFKQSETLRADIETLGPALQLKGFVSQSESLELQRNATMLLLIQDPVHLASKLFEYLQSGTPIFAITPLHGQTASILNETGGGICVEPENTLKIRDSLLDFYTAWKSQGKISMPRNLERLAMYSRKSQTQKLHSLLQQVTQMHNASK